MPNLPPGLLELLLQMQRRQRMLRGGNSLFGTMVGPARGGAPAAFRTRVGSPGFGPLPPTLRSTLTHAGPEPLSSLGRTSPSPLLAVSPLLGLLGSLGRAGGVPSGLAGGLTAGAGGAGLLSAALAPTMSPLLRVLQGVSGGAGLLEGAAGIPAVANAVPGLSSLASTTLPLGGLGTTTPQTGLGSFIGGVEPGAPGVPLLPGLGALAGLGGGAMSAARGGVSPGNISSMISGAGNLAGLLGAFQGLNPGTGMLFGPLNPWGLGSLFESLFGEGGLFADTPSGRPTTKEKREIGIASTQQDFINQMVRATSPDMAQRIFSQTTGNVLPPGSFNDPAVIQQLINQGGALFGEPANPSPSMNTLAGASLARFLPPNILNSLADISTSNASRRQQARQQFPQGSGMDLGGSPVLEPMSAALEQALGQIPATRPAEAAAELQRNWARNFTNNPFGPIRVEGMHPGALPPGLWQTPQGTFDLTGQNPLNAWDQLQQQEQQQGQQGLMAGWGL